MARFFVEYRVTGTACTYIEAASKEEAEEKVIAEIEQEDWLPDLDDVTDVDYHINQMYAIIRDGRRMETNYPRPTDTVISDA